jgi:hypothetical protein
LIKALEIIHQQRLLKNTALVQNGHVIGIVITSMGVVLLIIETIQFVKRSREPAMLGNATSSFFSTNLSLAILVILTGLGSVYLMLTAA